MENKKTAQKNDFDQFDPAINHDKVHLHWRTPEFIPLSRTPLWYMIASIIVISLVAYAIITNSATMAIVFILLAGMFFMTHHQTPRIVDVKITELGIAYDKKFYSYNTINAFWVVYHPPYIRSLHLRIGGRSFKMVKIELNHQNPVEVRRMLVKEIPEIEGMEEPIFDTLIRLLRLQ